MRLTAFLSLGLPPKPASWILAVLLTATACIPKAAQESPDGPGPNCSGSSGETRAEKLSTGKQVARGNTGCVADVATGAYHTCVLKMNGTLWCWGHNDYGQLGDGTTTSRSVPVQVASLGTGVIAVAAGGSHTCARKRDGTLWCWGENYYGELGDGTTESPKLEPVNVGPSFTDATGVTLGSLFTCAHKSDGTAWCWGYDYDGQLGNGVATDASIPRPAQLTTLPGDISEIEAGAAHACARSASGSLWCWGNNTLGQLGNGATADAEPLPVASATIPGCAAQVVAGVDHTCARGSDGKLWCWGNNDAGQLGAGQRGGFERRPGHVALDRQVNGMDLGLSHTCALTQGGMPWCWGGNEFGQLGNGAQAAFSASPVQPAAIGPGVVSVHTGYTHTCAVTQDSMLWCWGDNRFGQVANEDTETNVSSPAQVLSLCEQSF
ncbi:MAG TPA: hypothetical protein VI072_19485 [Polyangiaceae bacterium]